MSKLFDLTGQTAVITGASRGLGKEMAVALAQAGANIVMVSRGKDQLQKAALDVRAAAPAVKVLACPADVTNRSEIEAAFARAIKELGRIDILVNNAGINIRAPIEDIKDDDWARVQQVNVNGVLNGCRAVAPHMIARRYGRIINIGSALSLIGLAHRVPYCASKGAVLAMTKALAVELADKGITVNCICPGPFATEINRPLLDNPAKAQELLRLVPMNRWGELHEIQAPVVFLASPAAAYVTGCALTVDGGWTAW
jgi:NAD(P)-dependent dehydrogenase (short-subunit alcohol dehydrogenase family)